MLDAPKDAGHIAGLLSGKVTELPKNSEILLEKWHEMKGAIQSGLDAADAREKAEREAMIAKRLAFEETRQNALDAINKKLANGPL